MTRFATRLTVRLPALAAIVAIAGAAGCMPNEYRSTPNAKSAPETYDLWIRNGLVHDGSGGPPVKADVVVDDDRIVRVGDVEDVRAAKVIDATGKIVAPGFIDMHSHGDPLEDESFRNFALQGVTTVVLGQDGSTPGSGGDEGSAPDENHSLASWMDAVEDTDVQTNVVALVGHGTLRSKSGVGVSTEPTPEQMQSMQSLLRAGLSAGAFGMSSGLEYVPGRYADRDELVALAETVGRAGGVVVSHMRTEDSGKIAAAIDELIAQGAWGPVHASHLKIVFAESAEEADRVIAQLEAARRRGVEITADVYPYLAGYGDLALLYPPWAKTREQWDRILATDRARLENYLRERIALRGGADAILLADAPYTGKTLAQVAREMGKPAETVVIEMGYRGPNAAHFIMRQDVQDRLLAWEHAAVSTDGGPWVRHPRSWGTYPKVLAEYVRERRLIDMEQAIRKMSGLPASIVGLPERGRIEEGNYADLVIFSPDTVRSNATWSEPAQAPTGIEYVIVNGCVQVEEGRMTERDCGRLLRKPTAPTD